MTNKTNSDHTNFAIGTGIACGILGASAATIGTFMIHSMYYTAEPMTLNIFSNAVLGYTGGFIACGIAASNINLDTDNGSNNDNKNHTLNADFLMNNALIGVDYV